MASKTIKFLPTIFQTEVNEKFLSATLDQLISEPDLRKIYGYIGRTFAPTYKSTDSYINETTVERQNYQLEPSVVIKNTSNEVTFFSSYVDLLNKIKFYGGITNNHNRLFENEYYSFDPLIDFDKFVNFSQYYWLPNGPDPVDVYTGQTEFEKTYTITRNNKNKTYNFTSTNSLNPTIILARGGTYTFEVNQPGNNFWIQQELGIDGKLNNTPTISSRQILGVTNNGIDSGSIVFKVPQRNAQDRFIDMSVAYAADFTTSATYSDIQGNLVSLFFAEYGGFDGMVSQLDGKTLIFVNQDQVTNPQTFSIENPYSYEEAWTIKGRYTTGDWDSHPWGFGPDIWDRSQFEQGITVPEEDRVSVWKIKLIPSNDTLTFNGNITALEGSRIIQSLSGASAIVLESVVNSNTVRVRYENSQVFITGTGLIRINDINQTVCPINASTDDYIMFLDNKNIDGSTRRINYNEKVYVKSGLTNSNKEFYRDIDGLLKEMPNITSNLDTLYYQDGTNSGTYGEIKIIDVDQWLIDVDKDILGRKTYTSPNGVIFTNGLKVKFDVDVTPESYRNNEYYIEGVGNSITLTPVDVLITPELYHETLSKIYNNVILPDYVLINRSSIDLNPWSRNNRWFHKEVIEATNRYNNPTQPAIYDQSLRAVRPIIEFEPNIKLFNNGKIGKKQVHILDNKTEDAFNLVQGQNIEMAYGITLFNGMRIIFSADKDPLVRNKIYIINFIYTQIDELTGEFIGSPQINLVQADDGNIEEYDSIVISDGYFKGTSWWFNGVSWIESQQKTNIHQSPMFDVFDNNNNSFETYKRSTFIGTKIFGYKIPTVGVDDTVLKFPLSYRNFGTQGEIEFQNYFDTDNLEYFDGTSLTTIPVNFGVINKIVTRTESTQHNVWNNVKELSKQYQRFSYVYTGITKDFTLPVDSSITEESIPYVKVYKNSKLLDTTLWTKTGLVVTVTDSTIINNDVIDILVFSDSAADNGQYQIPLNLDFNAQNLDFSSLTLGQMRNHVIELAENSNDVIGNIIGSNNLRDLQYKNQGGNILQHSAPVPYSSLFLVDETSNFINSVILAQQEYSKFKNKFLELSVNLTGINASQPAYSVDLILKTINGFKNSSFPWYYSDMVPYGDNKTIIDIPIFDPLVKSYEISNVFDDSNLSNKSVLVYLNSDPSAIYIDGTGINVTSDILNKSAYVTPNGVVFENGLKIRFGSNVTPTQYQNISFIVRGVGSDIYLETINNNVQLIKGRDYTFDQTKPAITISNNVTLEVDYRITIVEYNDTDGNYIPETPTKLGLYPKFTPEIVEDDTYRTTINVIIGHDGSKTPVFGDYRDDFLLELERRIYNNIKVDYTKNIFDIYDVIPGKFRNSGYSFNEFESILTLNFLSWIGNSKLDYSSNTTFQSNDGFTWNYSLFSDVVNGEKLPGSWRSVFKYFYDTETPHKTPWEMLGFSEKPTWWEDYYGPAPYTGDNFLLWEHLSEGRIADGDRVGIDSRFARPGLMSIIPVNSNGFLRSPVEFLTASFNSKNAATAWAVGAQGPVETVWRRSSDFPYAIQIALALTKPARYFGSLIDTKNYNYDTNLKQYVITSNKHHIKQTDILVNGDSVSGTIYRSAGYINWIADYLTNQGINPYITINDMLSTYSVNLSYKVAGFTDQKYLRILAEQYSPTSTNDSIVIPDENYTVSVNKSTPVQKIVYSSVIVEKTTNGYSVRGYNLSNPYFTIIPSIVNNHSTKITVLNETATVFFDYQNLKITVPYGYEFKSRQQIVDFLISYERYLIAQGFIFEDVEETLGEIKNWILSAKEFLFWAQQGWGIGSILVLSPVSNSLNVITNGSIVDTITDNVYGSKVIDQNFRMIKNIEYKVLRSSTNFNVSLTNQEVLGLVELSLVQYEHILVFDNITVFNDVIYKPELGNRQYRLKLVGQKTNNWDGSLSPAGFIYNSGVIATWNSGKDYLKGELVKFKEQYYVALENLVATDTFNFSKWKQIDYNNMKKGLLSNFASIAKQGETFYDNYSEMVDSHSSSKIDNSNKSHYSYGLIGFRPRQYLNDLGLTDTSQVDLYKGFIKQKGTVNAVNALTTAQFNQLTGEIGFYEEWAVRVGEYGALDINSWVEVPLDEKTFSTSLEVLEFLNTENQNLSNGLSLIGFNDLHKSSTQYVGTISSNRDQYSNLENDIPSAGFVNLNDVDATIFDLSNFIDLNSQIDNIGSGFTIWCSKDFNLDWNVYRVSETNNFVTLASNALDGLVSFTTKDHHKLSAGSVILIKNFNTVFDGFYQVYKIINLNTFLVKYSGSLTNITSISGNGLIFTLDSLRFEYMENVRVYNPLNGWNIGEKVWIEKTVPNNGWGVFEKKEPWNFSSLINKSLSEYTNNDGFGTSLKMNDNGTVIATGSPLNTTFFSNGTVDLFVKTSDYQFSQTDSLFPVSDYTIDYGYSLDLTNDILVVGAPSSEEINRGHVYIYKANSNTSGFKLIQILRGFTASGKFGSVVSLSRDSLWLYISSVNDGTVYAYSLDKSLNDYQTVVTIGPATTSITLDWTPKDQSSTLITGAGISYIPGLDYTILGNIVTFITVPDHNVDIAITQTQCYILVDTIVGESADEFGSAISVSAEGAQIAIGAPGYLNETGIVYVYDRSIESFKSTGLKNYTVTNSLATVCRVTVDGVEVFDYSFVAGGNTVTFNTIPDIGSIVSIETNLFNVLQTLSGSTPQPSARFGTSITICSFNCAIYVGAPGFDVTTGIDGSPANAQVIPLVNKGTIVNSGAVFKNHNQGRLYGTIAGTTINPQVNPGDSIRLNDFEIIFTGFTQIVDEYGNVVKQLTLSNNISANIGDYITQTTTSANVTVLENVVNSNIITVSDYNTANSFNFGTSAGNISINGSSIPNTVPVADINSVVSDINFADILGISAVVESKVFDEVYFKDDITGNWYNSSSVLITDTVLLIYLNSTTLTKVKINSGTYYRINRVWYDLENFEITDQYFIQVLESNVHLRLNSKSSIARNKMRVLSGTGSAITDLGLEIFVQMQIITSPNNIIGERFGSKVSLNRQAHSLVVSSTVGSTIIDTTFDNNQTLFDDDSTKYKEPINSSGAAYLFELYDDPRDSVELPGRYSFTQQFNPGDLNPGDQFGWAIDIINNYVVVSAPNDSTTINNGGSIYLFVNTTNENGWSQISSQSSKVNVDSIHRIYLYDSVKNVILTNLETIDPAKGKILGQAEQEITYKTSIDPAIYNRGTKSTVTLSEYNYWNAEQQYQVWWNLDKVRYIEYEQSDLTYRSLNWGKLFPGSEIEICEWTESLYLPSQYVSNNGDGVPLYNDDSAYAEVISVDPVVGTILIKYYYWVKNKSTLSAINSNRMLPTTGIANLIENPSIQGIPYAAVIQDNAMIFYNIVDYLTDKNTILHIDYGTSSDNIIHNEYELIKSSPNNIISTKIFNKLIDSLSGINKDGQSVPDPKLKDSEKYGISIRPRQTMFVNRLEALDRSIVYINSVLKNYHLTDYNELTFLTAEDSAPSIKTGLWEFSVNTYEELYYQDIEKLPIGYRILVQNDQTQDGLWVIYIKNSSNEWDVNRVQSYKTSQYWTTVDWYSSVVSSETVPDYTVSTIADALKLPYAAGDIIKILNNGEGNWILIQVIDLDDDKVIEFDGVNEFVTVASQNGAIQIDRSISNYSNSRLGYDNQGFSEFRFDQDPSIEIRYLLEAILQAAELRPSTEFKSLLNDLFFMLINYIHSEQSFVDWIFKTSFVSVFHQLRSLTQTPNYINDNQTYYEDYINEVKPYKTKIREYVVDYTGNDEFLGSVTDFDLAPYYDKITETFRSPSGEIPLIDESMWQTEAYNDWYNNRTYEIGNIVVTNPGTGYTEIPVVEINSNTGSGALAHAILDYDTGSITDIIVDNPGSGYESVITVTINGNGTGATAYAVFKQNQPRSISTQIKFDRISYKSSITQWSANTSYKSDDIISYLGKAYQVKRDEYGNVITYTSDSNIDFSNLTVFSANMFSNSNDRIVGYYQPNNDMPVIETITETIITANSCINSDIIFVSSLNEGIYVNSVKSLQKGMFINGAGSNLAIITDVVANVTSKINYIQVDRPQTLDGNIVLTATYNNLGQLMTGIDYPGISVVGPQFDDNPGFDIGASFGSVFDQVDYDTDGVPLLSSGIIDSIIQSNYTDNALGTRPEDIIVDGGAFVDRFSSHAPEEMVPGIMFDTLDIKVLTEVSGSTLAYRIFNNMLNVISYTRLSSANSTTLSSNLNMLDTTISVTDGSKLPVANATSGIPGVIFVGSERITYFRNYAQEVTEWSSGINYPENSILSYGNIITLSANITARAGDYITQASSGANAVVGYDCLQDNVLTLHYVNSNIFDIGSGNIQIVDNSNYGNVLTVSVYPVSSNIAYFETTDTIWSSEFIYSATIPLKNNDINVLGQIRRGTEGTGTPLIHIAGESVYDASELQTIPGTSINSNVLLTSTTFNVAEKPSYTLRLEGNITANVGDIISQSFISGANVFVLNNVVNSNVVIVTYNTTNEFVCGNIVAAGYGLLQNGVSIPGVYPQSMTLRGYNINANGNVTLSANTTVIKDTIWNKPGVGTATDGSGFGTGTISNWTIQEAFLWSNPYA